MSEQPTPTGVARIEIILEQAATPDEGVYGYKIGGVTVVSATPGFNLEHAANTWEDTLYGPAFREAHEYEEGE